jgi:hypothetical protein
LGTELAASHYLGADALAPHAGQGAVQRDGGIRLIDAMDYPAVEQLEQMLSAADRGVERHMLAGGVAVEGDVQVVDPGAGHHDSFCDRTQRLKYRPTGWPGLIAGADIVFGAPPRPCVSRRAHRQSRMFRVSAAAVGTGLAADRGHETPGVCAVLMAAGPCLIRPVTLALQVCQG